MAGTLEIPAEGSPNTTEDPKIKAAIKAYNESLNSENDVTYEGIAKGNLGRLYAPTVIATEESRTNTAFATLTTADEVKSVVLPENGLIQIGYRALIKSSVSAAGRAAIFIGANQLKTEAGVQESISVGTTFHKHYTFAGGIGRGAEEAASFSTTGEAIAVVEGGFFYGGLATIFAAAGTYNISVQYRATSGSVTAKERKLWVGVLGV